MGNFADLLTGLMWTVFGILLLLNWRYLYQGAVDTHNFFWGRLGIPFGSERINQIFARIVVTIVGATCILAGVEDLYEFLTGREFPLRYMQWNDLWPF